ncbi:AlbA family DNA-binding domain-containing protein [Parapedobacter sp.]
MTIKALILQGEGEQLDFKNRISNCAKIAKTLVAFANTKGGKLLVGVADNGTIKGIKNEEEEKYMLLQAGQRYCRPPIEPVFTEITIDDKLVLVADIGESDTKPHYALDGDQRWWVYVRAGDKSLLAGKVAVDVLHQNNNPEGVQFSYTEKERALMEYVHAHPRSQLPELCDHLQLSRRRTRRILVNLIVAGVIEVHNDGHGEYFTEKPNFQTE